MRNNKWGTRIDRERCLQMCFSSTMLSPLRILGQLVGLTRNCSSFVSSTCPDNTVAEYDRHDFCLFLLLLAMSSSEGNKRPRQISVQACCERMVSTCPEQFPVNIYYRPIYITVLVGITLKEALVAFIIRHCRKSFVVQRYDRGNSDEYARTLPRHKGYPLTWSKCMCNMHVFKPLVVDMRTIFLHVFAFLLNSRDR